MITPSFGLTATERVLPKLALDFTTAVLDSRVTFTRSGATATCVNSSGDVATVAANTPRFDYNPVTLVCEGLLIEESRTNLQIQSDDFGAWVTANVSIDSNNINSPDGTQNADKITDDATSGIHRVSGSSSISFTAGVSYALSVFAKAGTATVVQLCFTGGGIAGTGRANFNLATGALGTVSGGNATITPAGDGWYRCIFTVVSNSTTTSLASVGLTNNDLTAVRQVSYSGSDQYAYIWGAQLEAGSFATSYIPTTTSQVTRSADVATMTGTNFSDWFNASEGTLFAQYQTTALASAAVFSIADDIVAPLNYIYLLKAAAGTTNRFNITSAGVSQGNNDVGSLAINTTYRLAGGYAANNSGFSVNSSAVVTDASVTLPTGINQAVIGRLFNQYVNGTIAEISYYPLRLTNAEIRSISK